MMDLVPVVPLVCWLIARQKELGLADRPFARRLGVTGAYWGMVRRGERRIGLRVVQGSIKAFPEYEKHITKLALSEECEAVA